MKKFFLSFLLALSALAPAIFMAAPAHAVDARTSFTDAVKKSKLVDTKSDTLPTIASVLDEVIFSVLSLVGVLILILIIYAGFQWATARGNDTQVQTAQKTLIRGVIGLIIVFASFALTNFVLSGLRTATTAPAASTAPATGSTSR